MILNCNSFGKKIIIIFYVESFKKNYDYYIEFFLKELRIH